MDFLKVAVIILFVILTVITIKIHPEIHQPMLIEDENFKLVRISDTITTKNIPVTVAVQTEQTEQTQQVETVQPVSQPVEINIPEQPEQTKSVQINTPQTPDNKKTIQLPKKEIPVQTASPEPSQAELLQRLLNTDIEDTKALQENAQKLAQTLQEPHQQITKPTISQTSADKNPYMTEQEELIAWNKWRSNIQNRIMKNSNIEEAPLGTIFMFSFLVDKFGNVSNIKVTCSNPNYMDMARNNMKPAISNLQRKPILNFPRGTQRTSTVVTGSIILGTFERYSTPSDYHDYERVVH